MDYFELSTRSELVTIINKVSDWVEIKFKCYAMEIQDLACSPNNAFDFCIDFALKCNNEIEKREIVPQLPKNQIGIYLNPELNPNGKYKMHKIGRPGSNQFLIIDQDTIPDDYVEHADFLLRQIGWKRILEHIIEIYSVWGTTISEFTHLVFHAEPWLNPRRLYPIGQITFKRKHDKGEVMQLVMTCRRHCLNNQYCTRKRKNVDKCPPP